MNVWKNTSFAGRAAGIRLGAGAWVACWACAAGAVTHYVDSIAGDDARDGLSEAAAWRTLNRANEAEMKPGDRMLFRRGGEWRGQLELRNGAPGARTYYGAYGVGPKPVLRGSVPRDREEDWEPAGPGLWATRSGERGRVGACLREAAALNAWHASYEAHVRGKMTVGQEKGQPFLHVACSAAPEGGGSRNHLQLWGPSVEGLPGTMLLRFRIRGGFAPQKMTVIMPRRPYTICSEEPVFVSSKADAEGWRDAEALVCANRQALGPFVLHFYLGALARTGRHVDIQMTGLYRYAINARARLGRDVGILLFDGGAAWGVKKWSLRDLREDLDYWYDAERDRVVVKLDRNPARAYKSVELALTRTVIPHANRHDVTVEAFTIRDSGGFAFAGGGAADLTIRNCDICYIGGGLQYWKKDAKGNPTVPVRYGNGIEFWSPARDCLVSRCRFWQIYDAAVTPQQSRSTNGFDRIVFRDNVFWQCEYSYEFWNHDPKSHCRDIIFEHNTSVDAGACWSHAQRPDPNGAHLMSYVHVGAMSNQVIRNNIFCRSTNRGFRFFTDWRSSLAMDHNLHYEPLNVLSQAHTRPGQGLAWKFGAGAGEFARYRDVTGLDAGSAYGEPQFVDPGRRDYRLKPGTLGTALATDGGPVGARDMPGLDRDQSVMPTGGGREAKRIAREAAAECR